MIDISSERRSPSLGIRNIDGSRMEKYGKLDLVRFDFIDCPEGSKYYFYVGGRGLVEMLRKSGKSVAAIKLKVYRNYKNETRWFNLIQIENQDASSVLLMGATAEGGYCNPFGGGSMHIGKGVQ